MTPGPDDPPVRYDVDETFELSAVTELTAGPAGDDGGPGSAAGAAPEMLSIAATYFDTADHRLLDAGLEIRREVGSGSAGWHLSVRLPGAVHERRAALGRSERTVPIQLRRLVWAASRGAVLQPVAEVSIDREIHQFARDDSVVVEIDVDRVSVRRLTASPEPEPETHADAAEAATQAATWTELSVRSTGADQLVPKRVDRQLRRLGARRAAAATALARGLAALPGPGGAAATHGTGKKAAKSTKAAGRQRFSGLSPAGAVVVDYLAQELATLVGQDISVRLDCPDSLHQMRVATRRLRSAMHTFRGLFVAAAIEPLDAELKWLAGELGRARDAEVLRGRLLDAVHVESSQQLADRSVIRSVDRETRQSQRTAFDAVVAALNSERYRLLVAGLELLVSDPPLTERAARPARKQLRRLVAGAYVDVQQALAAADGTPPGPDRDAQLHGARKAAKRARYAAEAVRPAFGKEAKAFAAAMERLQDVLGDYNDSVVLQDRLHEMALAGLPATAFALGRLHAQQAAQQAMTARLVERAATAAEKKSLRDWLT